jgi:hypothetical protein
MMEEAQKEEKNRPGPIFSMPKTYKLKTDYYFVVMTQTPFQSGSGGVSMK